MKARLVAYWLADLLRRQPHLMSDTQKAASAAFLREVLDPNDDHYGGEVESAEGQRSFFRRRVLTALELAPTRLDPYQTFPPALAWIQDR